ncbi:OsmC family protein [Formosa sediminum]|uniref:OsmC family protein n=2 Tax=Formosa sediminum TaxID=2594004 RepID=A0A516GW13_9FLAO|nr:OsmC family protein [Formosa sediminum]
MEYQISANSRANQDAELQIKEANINFGTTAGTANILPNPAELFLGAFSACMLKNVERFSKMMKFSYTKATVDVHTKRLENPPRLDHIHYDLKIYSTDKKLNLDLLQKNIEKHGTIYNTVKLSCTITGTIKKV